MSQRRSANNNYSMRKLNVSDDSYMRNRSQRTGYRSRSKTVSRVVKHTLEISLDVTTHGFRKLRIRTDLTECRVNT